MSPQVARTEGEKMMKSGGTRKGSGTVALALDERYCLFDWDFWSYARTQDWQFILTFFFFQTHC